jgi:hypothetical protein
MGSKSGTKNMSAKSKRKTNNKHGIHKALKESTRNNKKVENKKVENKKVVNTNVNNSNNDNKIVKKATSNKKVEKKFKSTNKRKTWKKIDTTDENKIIVKKLQKKIEENDTKDINIDDYITYDVEKNSIPEGFLGRKTNTLSTKNNPGIKKLLDRQVLKITENKKKPTNKNDLNLIEDIWGSNTVKTKTKLNPITMIRLKDCISNNQYKDEKKIISLPKLTLPHPGLSYNPNIQDSKNLIYSVAGLNKGLYAASQFTNNMFSEIKKSNEDLDKRMKEMREKEKEKRKLRKKNGNEDEDSDSESEEDYESSSEEVDDENSENNVEEKKEDENKYKYLKRTTEMNREHRKNLNRLKGMKDKVIKENKKEIYSLVSSKRFGRIQDHNMNEQEKIEDEKRKLSRKNKNMKMQGAVVE